MQCLSRYLFFLLLCVACAKKSVPSDSSKKNVKTQKTETDAKKSTEKPYVYQIFHPSARDSNYLKEKDLGDLFLKTSKKNDKPKTRQKNVYWSLFPSEKVSPTSSITLVTLGNIAFYLGEKSKTHLSSITGGAIYSFDNSFAVPLRLTLWTPKNKLYLTGDWRYLHYPENTYGLGGSTKPEDKRLITYSYIRFYQAVLKRLKAHWFYGLGYQLDYHFNLNTAINNQAQDEILALAKPSVSSGLSFHILADQRLNSINPYGGYYFSFIYRVNETFFGSDNQWHSIFADYRKYYKVGHKNNVLALSAFSWLTFAGSPPYLDMPSIGWDPYGRSGRGYSQGRFREKEMLYVETEYRFKISSNGLFGAVLFLNAATYSEPVNKNFSYILPSAGTGLRLKINKNSRTNFSLDAGKGLYEQWNVWVNIGEVF